MQRLAPSPRVEQRYITRSSHDKRDNNDPKYKVRAPDRRARIFSISQLGRILLGMCFVGILLMNVSVYRLLHHQGDLLLHQHEQSPFVSSSTVNSNAIRLNSMTRRAQGLDDTIVWERIRRNLERKHHLCETETTSTTERLRGHHHHHYLSSINVSRKETMSQLLRQLQSPQSTSTFRCQSPSPCESHINNDYGIIVTTKLSNPRTLLLNCLSWLLDAHAKEIWILLPKEHRHRLEDDDYASRLVSWNKQGNHPVKVIIADTLWQAVKEVDERSNLVASVITWRNGDLLWSGTRAGMDAVLTSWRRNTGIVYASHGWTVDASTRPCEMSSNKDSTEVLGWMTQGRSISSGLEAVPTRHLLLDINGLVFHRNYLCFLNHPILAQMRQLSSISWQLAEFGLTLAVMDAHISMEWYQPRLTTEDSTHSLKLYKESLNLTVSDWLKTDDQSVEKRILQLFGGLPRYSDVHGLSSVATTKC